MGNRLTSIALELICVQENMKLIKNCTNSRPQIIQRAQISSIEIKSRLLIEPTEVHPMHASDVPRSSYPEVSIGC